MQMRNEQEKEGEEAVKEREREGEKFWQRVKVVTEKNPIITFITTD